MECSWFIRHLLLVSFFLLISFFFFIKFKKLSSRIWPSVCTLPIPDQYIYISICLSVCLSVWRDNLPAKSSHPCVPLRIHPWISHPFHFYRWLVRSCCLADSATVEHFFSFFSFPNLYLRGIVCFHVPRRLVRRRRHQRLWGVSPQLRDLQRAGQGRLSVMCGRQDAGRWRRRRRRRVPVRARGLSRQDLSQRWDFLHVYILLIHLSTYNEGGIWAPCRGQGEILEGNWFCSTVAEPWTKLSAGDRLTDWASTRYRLGNNLLCMLNTLPAPIKNRKDEPSNNIQ